MSRKRGSKAGRQARLLIPSSSAGSLTSRSSLDGTVELLSASHSSSEDGRKPKMTSEEMIYEMQCYGCDVEHQLKEAQETKQHQAAIIAFQDEELSTLRCQMSGLQHENMMQAEMIQEHLEIQKDNGQVIDVQRARIDELQALNKALQRHVEALDRKLAAQAADAKSRELVIQEDFTALLYDVIVPRDAKIAATQLQLATIVEQLEECLKELASLQQQVQMAACIEAEAAMSSSSSSSSYSPEGNDEDRNEGEGQWEAEQVDGSEADAGEADDEDDGVKAARRDTILGGVHRKAAEIRCHQANMTPVQDLPAKPSRDNIVWRLPEDGVWLGDPSAASVLAMVDRGPATNDAGANHGSASEVSTSGRKVVLKRLPLNCYDGDSLHRARSEVAKYLAFSSDPRVGALLPRALQVGVVEATSDERRAGCSHALVLVMEAAQGNLRECLVTCVEQQQKEAAGAAEGVERVMGEVARFTVGMLEVVQAVHEAGWLLDDAKPLQFVKLPNGSVGAIDLQAWRAACDWRAEVGPCALGDGDNGTHGFEGPERHGGCALLPGQAFSCAASDVYAIGQSVTELMSLAQELAGASWDMGRAACAPVLQRLAAAATLECPTQRLSVRAALEMLRSCSG